MKKQIIKGVVELVGGAAKAAPKGRKRGRKTAAQRADKNLKAQESHVQSLLVLVVHNTVVRSFLKQKQPNLNLLLVRN
jgi:hypothetical protein